MNGTKKERKEVLLEEHDPIWVEMRDLFIADVCTTYFYLSHVYYIRNQLFQKVTSGQNVGTGIYSHYG